MSKLKNKPLKVPAAFRLRPEAKAGLEAIAEHTNRSQANVIEVLVNEYCAAHGIAMTTPNNKNTK